jgi:hypothetical protein
MDDLGFSFTTIQDAPLIRAFVARTNSLCVLRMCVETRCTLRFQSPVLTTKKKKKKKAEAASEEKSKKRAGH